jgi:hypothetical protein
VGLVDFAPVVARSASRPSGSRRLSALMAEPTAWSADSPGNTRQGRRRMTSRRELLRRAGAGAAGFTLAELLGPAAALAGDGGGDFRALPDGASCSSVHSTLDPLLVATQFGAQDAASLVRCTTQWTGSPRGDLKRR